MKILVILFLSFALIIPAKAQMGEPVDLRFQVIEVPWKTLRLLLGYLDRSESEAKSAFSKLTRVSGVRTTAEFEEKLQSGARYDFNQSGIRGEGDMVAMPNGFIDLLYTIELEQSSSPRVVISEQVYLPGNRPFLLHAWGHGDTATALFVNATRRTRTSERDGPNFIVRYLVELVEAGDPDQARQLAKDGVPDAIREAGEVRRRHLGNVLAGNLTSSSLDGDTLILDTLLGGQRKEHDTLIYFGQSKLGRVGGKTGEFGIGMINDDGEPGTLLALLHIDWLYKKSQFRKVKPPTSAPDDGGFIMDAYPVRPGFLRDLASAKGIPLSRMKQPSEPLEAHGIPFPSGANVMLLPQFCELMMKNTPEAHDALQELIRTFPK